MSKEFIQQEAEKLRLEEKVNKLELALQGIASCATQCVCCEMHRRIAVKALGYEVGITTDSV